MGTSFTKETKFPYDTGHTWTYTDMRGNHWTVKPKPGVGLDALSNPPQWLAYPDKDAAEAYELSTSRMDSAATDAGLLIDGIEEKIEIARANGTTPGRYFGTAPAGASTFPWWLVVLGVAAYYHNKKRRRR